MAGGRLNACCCRAGGEQERGKTQRFNAPADVLHITTRAPLQVFFRQRRPVGLAGTGPACLLLSAGPNGTPIPSNEVGRGVCWALLDAKTQTRRRACNPWPPPRALRTRSRSCTAIEEITSAQELELGGFKAQAEVQA
jgi:hypothetical protein